MTNSTFTQTLKNGRMLFLDGAMGTMLQAAGMAPGEGPERFCLANPEILKNIHKAYINAGSNIITTATFGANSFKLPPDLDVHAVNREMARIALAARQECPDKKPVFIAGNAGPTGVFAKPLGSAAPADIIAAYAAQISALASAGVDLIFMETQFDIAEVRLAVAAARQVCDVPVMVSMTFEQGRSLTGSTPEIFAETMQNLGCDVIGTNCSLGPEEMLPVVRQLLACCSTPVLAEPNAGLPELRDGKTVFPLPPAPFAEQTAKFAKLGAQILGGCCGTTPEHVSALVKACAAIDWQTPPRPQPEGVTLTSRSGITRINANARLAVIGERINPTGKPALAESLRKGDYGEALRLADEQIAAGATLLDVNVGASLVDEQTALTDLVCLLSSRLATPLSLDSSSAAAITQALPYYPASCLINSISGEPDKMQTLGPVCRDFGAPFILLPLQGAELPRKAAERIAIIENLLEETDRLGIPGRLVMVDCLALSASSVAGSARECLEVIRWCERRGLATTVGLSNISFGLPARGLLNSTFLCMAAGAGLTSCIANPDAEAIINATTAMAALVGQDPDCETFIGAYADWKPGEAGSARTRPKSEVGNLYEAVLKGDREKALPLLEKELAEGRRPFAIVNETLIPAITEVGNLYEQKKYFLPQLIRSAETMQAAFGRLEPLLKDAREALEQKTIVIATVEGDIHDIGKNIVGLMLGNHGFRVIDAGKNVPAKEIVDLAIENGAAMIGLSALMTTTMVRMKDTIDLLRERHLPIKVIVGGAAVTREFAESIGADAYCEDAVASVNAAKALLAA
ncbi:MAG: dihydropteroate synthase [Desulfovibrio sp.]|nr:dihydropteroate synthase [Desulfovibrio sp.]